MSKTSLALLLFGIGAAWWLTSDDNNYPEATTDENSDFFLDPNGNVIITPRNTLPPRELNIVEQTNSLQTQTSPGFDLSKLLPNG